MSTVKGPLIRVILRGALVGIVLQQTTYTNSRKLLTWNPGMRA